jgi:hypothetical protein
MPDNADIVISHSPPVGFGYGVIFSDLTKFRDITHSGKCVGSPSLTPLLQKKVKPILVS